MSIPGQAVSYITGQIRYICKVYKNRAAGSSAEYRCQQYLKHQLHACSDAVHEDGFHLHPHAFLGWIVPAAVLGMLSIAALWLGALSNTVLFAALGLGAIGVAVLMALLEYCLYLKFVDFLFPKRRSANIMGQIKPIGEIRRRIIFGGHADAAQEMTPLLREGRRGVEMLMLGCGVGMIYMLALQCIHLVHAMQTGLPPQGGLWFWSRLLAVVFIPFFIKALGMINWKRVVDGANDNLSGCLVSIGVLREMRRRGLRLDNTEVCCLITGAEEAGLRGADAFVRRHWRELSEVETIFIALDTLQDAEHLSVYLRGINGLQRNSQQVGALLMRAARRCGLRLKPADGIYPGATDAEAFSRRGLKSCALCGADQKCQRFYHTRHDTAQHVDARCIARALAICLEAAQLFDMV